MCAADGQCGVCSAGDSKGTCHVGCWIAQVKVGSGGALLMSCPAECPEMGDWLRGGPGLLSRAAWDVAGGYPLLWASTMVSTQPMPLTVSRKPLISCPQLLGLLTPGSPGWGQAGLQVLQVLWLLAWEDLLVSMCYQPCKSGAQSTGLGAPLGTLVSSLTRSLLEADLEIMSLLKQGHVLLC